MSNKKKINDIKISESREFFNNRKEDKIVDSKSVSSYKDKNKKIWPKFLISVGFILFIIIVISFFFHSVNVKVTSKKDNITFLNDVYTGLYNKDSLNNQNKNIKISLGKIKITNNTKDLQTLREETRFQFGKGDEKIVYKIFKRTSIKSNASITVNAYSGGYGEKYNKKKGNEKLRIPGFKEAKMTKEYENIFGQIEEDFSFSNEEVKNENSIKTLGYTSYEIFTISSESKKKISSIGVEEVFKKATGKIKIINNTNKNQKLRKETRFQNGDLIFKTQKSVTIPSNSFIIANAFANEAGRKYNINKDSKFVIPGFEEAKMTKEYEKIIGVVYSDFIGGMIGKINIPDKYELEIAKSNLNKESLELLQEKINSHREKKDYVFLDIYPNIENIFSTEADGEKIIVSLESTKKIPVIKKTDLIAMILKSNEVTSEKLNSIEIKDFSKLNFKIINEDNFDINSENDILFSVNGNAEISWILNENIFIKMIKGNSMSDVEGDLINSFKNFEFMISVSPFWRSSIPEDEKKITIILE